MGLQRSSRQAGGDGFGGQQQSYNRFPPAWGDARMANTPQVGGGGWNGQGGGGGLDRPHVLAGGGRRTAFDPSNPVVGPGGDQWLGEQGHFVNNPNLISSSLGTNGNLPVAPTGVGYGVGGYDTAARPFQGGQQGSWQGGSGQSITGPNIGQSTGYPTVPASSLPPAPIYNGPALDINPRMNPLTGGGQGSSYAFDPWAGQGYGGGGLDRTMPYNPGMGVRNYPFMRRY